MTLFLKLQEKYQDGREDEKKRLSLLVQKIINAGRNDELGKILTDTEALEKAYSEFGIPTDTDVSPVNL